LCDLLVTHWINFSSTVTDRSRRYIEYLRRQEANETAVAEIIALVDAPGFVDPEDYERAAQAAYFVRWAKKLLAAA
jgi:hypothetical protein